MQTPSCGAFGVKRSRSLSLALPIATGQSLKPLLKGRDDGICFGIDEHGLPVHRSYKKLSQHMLILGTTGSGKTSTIFNIVKQHFFQGGGRIFIDGKSENPTLFAFYRRLKEVNREDEMVVLSFRGSSDAQSSRWNFLMEGGSGQISELITRLRIPDGGGGDNQVFVDRRKQLLKRICGVVCYIRDEKKEIVTVEDLVNLIMPDCLLASICPSYSEVLNNPKLKKFARYYWVPDDYVEDGHWKYQKKFS